MDLGARLATLCHACHHAERVMQALQVLPAQGLCGKLSRWQPLVGSEAVQSPEEKPAARNVVRENGKANCDLDHTHELLPLRWK